MDTAGLEMSDNFMSIAEGQKDDAMSMLSSAFKDKITRNRSILHSILKTIYLCGKQNIPLRGDTEEKSNCIALINYRAETDQILATHLQNSPPNTRYLSPTIQNELIDSCGRQLQVIVSECNSANCFSVIADETTDETSVVSSANFFVCSLRGCR